MTKTNIRKLSSIIHVATLVFYIALSFSFVSPVYAQEDCTEEGLRDLGVSIVNCTGSNVCVAPTAATTAATLPAGSSIFVLGDSLTVGMRDAGGLEDKIVSNGWTVQKINALGGQQLNWGNDQITADSGIISTSNAIIIGLGTNNIGTVMDGESNLLPDGLEAMKSEVRGIVTNIKSINPTAKIYWTNVYITGTLNTEFGSFNLDLARPVINQAIEEVAKDNNVTVIPWGTSTEASALISTDGIHPSGKYQEMADYIVGQIKGGGSAGNAQTSDLAGCSCSLDNPIATSASKEERYQNTWNFFVTEKNLSPEAAAGIMGNLEAESGIDPQNTQNDAVDSDGNPVPDGPEIPIDAIRSKYGYGIAQWTSAGRQQGLIDFAASSNKSTGDLGLQLEYLWKELNESYTSVLAVLQTSNVTLEDASDEVLLRFEIPASVLPPPRGTAESRQSTINARRALSVAIYNTYSGLPAGSFTSATCADSSGGAVVIDAGTVDTSAIPCAPGSTDLGIVDAYNTGKPFVVRICGVGGTSVNSQLSGPLKSMFDKAAADGVALGGGSGFRPMESQIDVYNNWCSSSSITPTPPPYPKAKWSDNTRCPGAAPPGYSNHQMGFAIDFVCNGDLIPQSYSAAQNNPCFVWLTQNAVNYGLFEFGKGTNRTQSGYEAWHWSVDGS